MNNPCIKTGAVIFCENLSQFIKGDLFFNEQNGFTLRGCPDELAVVGLAKRPADWELGCDAAADLLLGSAVKYKAIYHSIPVASIALTATFAAYLQRWAPYALAVTEPQGALRVWVRSTEPINHFLGD